MIGISILKKVIKNPDKESFEQIYQFAGYGWVGFVTQIMMPILCIIQFL